jgi:sugar phosphate isomerase/epimerase
VQIGLCCNLALAKEAVSNGFDFAEVPAFEIALESHCDQYAGTAIECTNLMFPPGAKLFATEPFPWREYVADLLPKCAKLGVKVMTIGSGGARAVDPAFLSPAQAEHHFLDIVEQIQEMAAPLGITIAVESLSRNETNVWNDYRHLVQALDRRGLSNTFDVFHVLNEMPGGAELESFLAGVNVKPVHVHISNSARRAEIEDDMAVCACLRHLNSIGFPGRYSLEAQAAPTSKWPLIASNLRKVIQLQS